jgi:HAD superfamily phosphatase (TIGR01668 family)
MSNLRPTISVASVTEITPSVLSEVLPHVGGVVFDLDKTLVGQHEENIPQRHLDALLALRSAGLALGIISNASSETRTHRVQMMASSIGDVIGTQLTVVTSRMVGGKKKPLRPVFDQLSSNIGIANNRLCYVGDQLLKDILGANRAEYAGTVLVAPYGHGDDPRVKYLQRPIEALIRPLVGVPLFTKNF